MSRPTMRRSVPSRKGSNRLRSFRPLLEPLEDRWVPANFARGDVFVGVATGEVQWRRPDASPVATLSTTFGGETTGMGFDASGRLYVTSFTASRITRFDNTGAFLGPFGGTNVGTHPESVVFDAANTLYVGHADGDADVRRFDTTGALLGQFNVATEDRGSDFIDLAADQRTLFYTSEGRTVKRFDVSANTQLPDFATNLPGRAAFALRLLPDGGVMVANAQTIVRLNAAGAVVRQYDAAGQDNWFALNLDPDDTSFWSASNQSVFKFDIATGNVLLSFDAGSAVGGLAVFGEPTQGRPNPVGGADTVGAVDRDSNWFLRNTNSAGAPEVPVFTYGLSDNQAPGAVLPVVGDWDGRSTTTAGMVECEDDPLAPGTIVLVWKLRNSNSSGAPDAASFHYGASHSIPVTGDWNGDGLDTIGVVEVDTANNQLVWKLRNSLSRGAPDLTFAFGSATGTPVVGDWNGDGIDTPGVVENVGGVLVWFLRNANAGPVTHGGPTDPAPFAYGGAGWKSVPGDWNGDGVTTVGVFDPAGVWHLRNANAPGAPDAGEFAYGAGNFFPVVGDWDGATPVFRLRAAGGPGPGGPALTDAGLRTFAGPALGSTSAWLEVVQLPDDLLGLAFPAENRVLLDADAAGYGWFVDPTPSQSEEFDAALRALAGGPAAGRMDLWTVLRHELGHLAGQADTHDGGLLDGTLSVDTRR